MNVNYYNVYSDYQNSTLHMDNQLAKHCTVAFMIVDVVSLSLSYLNRLNSTHCVGIHDNYGCRVSNDKG